MVAMGSDSASLSCPRMRPYGPMGVSQFDSVKWEVTLGWWPFVLLSVYHCRYADVCLRASTCFRFLSGARRRAEGDVVRMKGGARSSPTPSVQEITNEHSHPGKAGANNAHANLEGCPDCDPRYQLRRVFRRLHLADLEKLEKTKNDDGNSDRQHEGYPYPPFHRQLQPGHVR